MSDEKTQKPEEVKASPPAAPTAKTENVVPAKFQDLVKQIEQMNVLDLSELIKILEEKFNVSSQMPMMAMPGASAASAAAPAVEEKTTFNVELASFGAKKIDVIKAVRAVTELGLKDAKDLVEAAPKMVKENATKEEAENIKKQLEAAGATVNLK